MWLDPIVQDCGVLIPHVQRRLLRDRLSLCSRYRLHTHSSGAGVVLFSYQSMETPHSSFSKYNATPSLIASVYVPCHCSCTMCAYTRSEHCAPSLESDLQEARFRCPLPPSSSAALSPSYWMSSPKQGRWIPSSVRVLSIWLVYTTPETWFEFGVAGSAADVVGSGAAAWPARVARVKGQLFPSFYTRI